MKKDDLNLLFKEYFAGLRRFVVSRDMVALIFFFLLSTTFWILISLKNTCQTTIKIPVKYEDIPEGLVKSENSSDTLSVTLEDIGIEIVKYNIRNKIKPFSPVIIRRKSLHEGLNAIPYELIKNQITKQLGNSTKVTKTIPDTLKITLAKLESKKVKVCLDAEIVPAPQYIRFKDVVITPSYVNIYGTEESLNGIDSIWTAKSDSLFYNVKDDMFVSIPLSIPKGVVCESPQVMVNVSTEQYTEKVIEVVAVNHVGVPNDKDFRTFPSSVKLQCKIPMSLWDGLGPSSFVLTANYEDAVKSETNTVDVNVAMKPYAAFDITLIPNKVEYLIEQRNTNHNEQ